MSQKALEWVVAATFILLAIAALVAIVGQPPGQSEKFHLGDRVRVISGFERGVEGICIADGWGTYEVESLKGRTKWFRSSQLSLAKSAQLVDDDTIIRVMESPEGLISLQKGDGTWQSHDDTIRDMRMWRRLRGLPDDAICVEGSEHDRIIRVIKSAKTLFWARNNDGSWRSCDIVSHIDGTKFTLTIDKQPR